MFSAFSVAAFCAVLLNHLKPSVATNNLVYGPDKRVGSQIGQDEWVLSLFGGPRFFVDVGANDGRLLSNTYKLEKAGWSGICVDPFPSNHGERKCKLVRAAVAGAVRNVTFVEAGTAGGIVDLLGANEKHTANGKAVQMQTKTLEDILLDANAPAYIDYLSLDSEGSELDILSTFPFWKYRFGAVTIETNGEEPKRTKIRQLMSYHGYTLERDALGQDDWFVSSCVSPAKAASFAVRYNDGRVARSRLRKKSQRLSTRTAD